MEPTDQRRVRWMHDRIVLMDGCEAIHTTTFPLGEDGRPVCGSVRDPDWEAYHAMAREWLERGAVKSQSWEAA